MMKPDVVKIIYLARRNPALAIDRFPERWRQHALLGGSLPSLRGHFVQVAQCLNIYDRSAVSRASLDFDGVNLLTLTERAAALAMNQDDHVHDIMLPDELETFSTYVRHFSLQATEHVVVDGPMQPVCLITFLKRDRHLDLETFGAGLIEASNAAGLEGLRTIVNLVEDRPPGYNFDAVSECWFRSIDQAAAHTRTREYKAFVGRRGALCDEGRSITMMTKVSHSWPAIATG